MRPGAGKGLLIALLAVAVAALAVPWAGASEPGPVATSLERAQPRGGAVSAANTIIFRFLGTDAVNQISAFADSTGRLVVSSPQGILEPDGQAPECTQDSPTQVSCVPGLIGAFAGDLGGGDDSFTIQSTLPTLVGISLVSSERPMWGGPGEDRILGGLGGDLIGGGPGDDSLLGFGGGDLMRGEAGRDNLGGGGAGDQLLGGGGPDRLRGGAGRDLCNGGAGVDSAKSCNVTRKIP